MKSSIDPRLVQLIEEADEDDDVEAVVILDKSSASAHDNDVRGVGGRVIDRVINELHQEPSELRFMPNLGAVYLKGKPRLLRHFLDEEEVQSASSTEAEFVV